MFYHVQYLIYYPHASFLMHNSSCINPMQHFLFLSFQNSSLIPHSHKKNNIIPFLDPIFLPLNPKLQLLLNEEIRHPHEQSAVSGSYQPQFPTPPFSVFFSRRTLRSDKIRIRSDRYGQGLWRSTTTKKGGGMIG